MKRYLFRTALMKGLLLVVVICTLASAPVSAQNTVKKETFVYSVKDTIQLQLDKYVDNSVHYEGKRPVFIYVHGGGFATGSRINALQIKYCKHFTAWGF